MNKGTGFLSFIAGALFGAVIALLYAPTSGEELRTQIRTEADAKLQQASQEWEKAIVNIQKSIDEMSSEMKAQIEQLSSKQQLEGEEPEVVVEVDIEEA